MQSPRPQARHTDSDSAFELNPQMICVPTKIEKHCSRTHTYFLKLPECLLSKNI